MASEEEEKDKKKAAPRKLFTDLEQRKPVVVKIKMPKPKIAKDLNAPKPAPVPQKIFHSLDQPAPAAKPARRKRKIFENL